MAGRCSTIAGTLDVHRPVGQGRPTAEEGWRLPVQPPPLFDATVQPFSNSYATAGASCASPPAGSLIFGAVP